MGSFLQEFVIVWDDVEEIEKEDQKRGGPNVSSKVVQVRKGTCTWIILIFDHSLYVGNMIYME